MDFVKHRYVGVGELDDVQLFYYFVESGRSPTDDPLVLWLTGGPGCSAFSGLVYEIGMYLILFYVTFGRNIINTVVYDVSSKREKNWKYINQMIIKYIYIYIYIWTNIYILNKIEVHKR
jgi:hypothetical protein